LKQDNDVIKNTVIDLITEKYEMSNRWAEEDVVTRKKDEHLSQVAYTHILRLKWRVVQKMMEDNKKVLQRSDNEEDIEKALQIHIILKNTEKEIASILGNVIR
jgi:DNA primase